MVADYITLKIRLGKQQSYSQYDFDQHEVVLGRHPGCDVVLETPGVSREHATITREGARFVLRDKGSTNGTSLNGRKLETKALLRHRDVISIQDASIDVFFGIKGAQAEVEKTVFITPKKPELDELDQELLPRPSRLRLFIDRLFGKRT